MRARTVSAWRGKLSGARNILALVMIAAVFALRSGVEWRRWQRRHLKRQAI